MAEWIAANSGVLLALALALVGAGAGYVRLQAKVAEQGRLIDALRKEDRVLHERISEKDDKIDKLREGQIRLEEGQKHIIRVLEKREAQDRE